MEDSRTTCMYVWAYTASPKTIPFKTDERLG